MPVAEEARDKLQALKERIAKENFQKQVDEMKKQGCICCGSKNINVVISGREIQYANCLEPNCKAITPAPRLPRI